VAVNLRQELGHWEGALAVGKQNKATFATSVERKSRLLRVSWISKLQFRSLPH
jgi:IS30 family transposase